MVLKQKEENMLTIKASDLENGDVVKICDNTFFANNVHFTYGDYVQFERIENCERYPYRLRIDETVNVIERSGSGTIGITDQTKWY